MLLKKDELSWYAVYTAPKAEKKVSERFSQYGIEHYLPLQKVKRRWSDRIKEVIIPVVNGYIFVRILAVDYRKITDVYGALNFIRQDGKPMPIPDNQMSRMRLMVELAEEPVEFCYEQFERSESILISRGPLQGMIGELVELKGKHKVLIRLEGLGCALTTVPLSFIKKIN